MTQAISIRGAREHNLQSINLTIPRNKLVVITGLSGSGKSSLAFDTIYAEGQRRYIESLSSYARQFLEKLKKPDVDHIAGLSPAISIEQRELSHNPRSTVATVTELYDYLRLLFAKVGTVFCYQCGRPIAQQSVPDMAQQLFQLPTGTVVTILAPLVRGRKGEYKKLFEDLRKRGFSKVRIDRATYSLFGEIQVHKGRRHDIEAVVDSVRIAPQHQHRLRQALETALMLAQGTCLAHIVVDGETVKRKQEKEILFSEKMMCPVCHIGVPELAPNMFSFNSPYGACPRCRGIGRVSQIAAARVISHPQKPLLKGALNAELNFAFNMYFIEDLAWQLKEYYHCDLKVPYRDLAPEVKEAFFWGNENIAGLLDELKDLFYKTSSEVIKEKIRKFMWEDECPDCHGKRLRQESLGVKICGKSIVEMTTYSIKDARDFFQHLPVPAGERAIMEPILKEIRGRLDFLGNVGLDYLTLDRTVNTLAGGELQRVRLAAQIGTGLTGVLYVLDEPTIGLHPRDNEQLLQTLENLRRMHNTVIIVEHDEATIRRADHVVDLGPRAGEEGGRVVAQGTVRQVEQAQHSLTGRYLRGELRIDVPDVRKPYRHASCLTICKAREHNLKNVTAKIPLGLLVCVTGVSGSGKSTLVHDILFKALHNRLWHTRYEVGQHERLDNGEAIDKVIAIDQSPIGRTPRSNPATYTDVFGHIRQLFSQSPDARLRNFAPGRFSFNVKGGRCETCRGEGTQKLAMSFLPDLYVVCEECRGKRYNEQTLAVCYKDKNIAEVLDMSIDEALSFFSAIPRLRDRLTLLQQIGLGYIRLGQSSTTLSGGEAQRIKLAYELGKRATGKTLYILDEPTTGLHFADIHNLLTALFQLREQGNTVLVIEHNLEVVKTADYIIDLGPEGGDRGGYIVACGTPEEVAQSDQSYTGQCLRNYLRR